MFVYWFHIQPIHLKKLSNTEWILNSQTENRTMDITWSCLGSILCIAIWCDAVEYDCWRQKNSKYTPLDVYMYSVVFPVQCSYSQLRIACSVSHCRHSAHRLCQWVIHFQGHASMQPHKNNHVHLVSCGREDERVEGWDFRGNDVGKESILYSPLLISKVQGQFIWRHSRGLLGYACSIYQGSVQSESSFQTRKR